MKKIFLILVVVFFTACSTKVIKKTGPSVEMQKQDAKVEWRELNKE